MVRAGVFSDVYVAITWHPSAFSGVYDVVSLAITCIDYVFAGRPALMTETAVKAHVVSAVSNLLGSTPLEKAMHDNLLRLGPPPFDDADHDFACKIQATLTEEDIESAFRRAGMPIKDVPLC